MNKVKNFFKDFWNFYRLTGNGLNLKAQGRRFSSFSLILVLSFLTSMLSMIHLDSSELFAFCLAASFIAMNIGQVSYDKTALFSVAPFSPRQRVVFTYLTVLLNALAFVAIVTVFGWAIVLIWALIAFCVSGENIFVTQLFTEENAEYVSANGAGVLILLFVILFFGTLALSHINNNKCRAVAAVSFFAANEILALSIANACGFAAQRGQGVIQNFFGSVDIMTTVDKLDYPWLLLTVLGVLAALSVGLSLWLVIRRHKSSNL